MDFDGMLMDDNVVEAFALYVTHGFNPGSFGTWALLGDINMAYRTAHPHLMDVRRFGQDIVKNTFKFISEYLPEESYNSKSKVDAWIAHQGLRKLDMSSKVLMRLQYGRQPWFMLKMERDAIDHIWGMDIEE
jgi:hypothetical protein